MTVPSSYDNMAVMANATTTHAAVIALALCWGWQVTCTCGAHARRMTKEAAQDWVTDHIGDKA